jgi:hypothetical protein
MTYPPNHPAALSSEYNNFSIKGRPQSSVVFPLKISNNYVNYSTNQHERAM